MKHYKQNITAMVTGMAIGASLVGGAAAGIVAEPTWQNPVGKTSMWMVSRYP